MGNIYDNAYVIEKDLREDSNFKQLSAAYTAVKNDSEAAEIFHDFKQSQLELQQKQLAGEKIPEETIQKAQSVVQKAQSNDLIKQMMQHEQAVTEVLQDVNKIITKPLQELYDSIQ